MRITHTKQRQTQVICTPDEIEQLRKRGLNVVSLHSGHSEPQLFLGGTSARCAARTISDW